MKKDEDQDASAEEEPKSRRGRKIGAVYFPRNSLVEALVIPRAIWEYNAGNPFSILDIASKTECSPTSSSFADLLRSSQRYGLTEGSWQQDVTKNISLTPLGSSIVAPSAGEDVNASTRRALETPYIFREVLSSINGKIIPPPDVLKNTLIKQYHLPNNDAEICSNVLNKNIQELDLAQDVQGKIYLRLGKLSVREATKTISATETEVEKAIEEEKHTAEVPEELVRPRVFISHSKNMGILDQIKQMLDFGGFAYEVAVERETTAIPIPEKIFGLMRKCNCAVINVSADEQEKRGDGTYGINQNVLVEIGAAFLQYNKRVILLVDRRVTLPSNLQGLYVCYYEGDELSWETGMKVQKALTEFRKEI